jgi:hypothetical protein
MIARKPLQLPAAVARRFIADMLAFNAEPNLNKRDEIALRQLHVLREYLGAREKLHVSEGVVAATRIFPGPNEIPSACR